MKNLILGLACALSFTLVACNEEKEKTSTELDEKVQSSSSIESSMSKDFDSVLRPKLKNVDSVLKVVASLQTTGTTLLCGPNCNDKDHCSENFHKILKAKGYVRKLFESDIEIGPEKNSRNRADILKVYRQRSPGLRHLYRRFLMQKPDFAGTVKLLFSITPDGKVVDATILSSSTGFPEFDEEVKIAVSRWSFGPVKSGKTSVTIPFAFSE